MNEAKTKTVGENTTSMYLPELGNGWFLTTEHPASSYGHPVLVNSAGQPHGCRDLVPWCATLTSAGIAVHEIAARRAVHDIPLTAAERNLLTKFTGLLF